MPPDASGVRISYLPRRGGSPAAVATADTDRAFHSASGESTKTLAGAANDFRHVASVLRGPGECHLRYPKRRDRDRAAQLQVVGDGVDPLEDLVEIRGDGDLAHRVRELAVLDPEALRAA